MLNPAIPDLTHRVHWKRQIHGDDLVVSHLLDDPAILELLERVSEPELLDLLDTALLLLKLERTLRPV